MSEKSEEYGKEVVARLKAAGLRVTGDFRPEKLGSKIRDAQMDLIPYMGIVGPRDSEAGTLALRDRVDGDLGALSIDDTISKLLEEVENRVVKQKFSNADVVADEGEAQNEY